MPGAKTFEIVVYKNQTAFHHRFLNEDELIEGFINLYKLYLPSRDAIFDSGRYYLSYSNRTILLMLMGPLCATNVLDINYALNTVK